MLRKNSLNNSVTSKDVAKLSGVSQSTVSRVFNSASGYGVKPDLKEKVLRAAQELGYRPNLVARGMSSGKTDLVALVVGDGLGPFYNKIIDTFTARIQGIGKQCLLFKISRQDQLDSIIEKVLQFHVEAIVITASAMTKLTAQTIIENDVPVVLFNRFIVGLDISMVYVDTIEGAGIVAEYFYNKGHRNIGYIQYKQETGEEAEKKFGFYSKLRQLHIYQIREEYAEYSYEDGYKAALRLLKTPNPPTAIFCTSDLMALGAIDAIRYELGLKVPEDIAVIGYDDIDMAQWKAYNLTSVHQPIDLLIDKTVEVVQQLLSGEKTIVKMIKPTLVERKSAITERIIDS